MKKIALDLDGVVFDTENLFRVYTEIYDVEYHKKDTLIDNTKKVYQKRYNWSKEECEKVYDMYSEEIHRNAGFMTGVDIVLKKIKEHFELIIVTSRNDLEAEIARERLKEIGLDDIKLFHNEHHKIDRLLEEKADYIIEDDDEICKNAADKNIVALYFKNNAANKVDKERVINVNNWGEIYKYLMLNNI